MAGTKEVEVAERTQRAPRRSPLPLHRARRELAARACGFGRSDRLDAVAETAVPKALDPVVGSAVPEVLNPVAVVARLALVDGEGLGDAEGIDLVAGLERLKGAASAAQARLTHALRVSVEERDPRDAVRSVGSQVALARRCSPTLGDRFVGLARALVTEMPATHASLTAGLCSERHAVLVVQATSVLSREDRAEVDRRVGPLLARLGVRQAERAARRATAELDAAAVVRRMEAAVASRRVTVRPAPDGMAYLSVLGPMVDVVGAHAALLARSRAVVGGGCADERPDGRGVGAVAADTALRLLSGRSPGVAQPVEVHLVMTDRSLLGTGDPDRSVMEPARVPGHSPVPAPIARAWLRAGEDAAGDVTPSTAAGTAHATPTPTTPAAAVWVRRLYTSPDGRDLVAMDSRRRLFSGLLRRMLVLRDDVCTTPWCEAPIVHADHATPSRDGGATSFEGGNGKCARCNGTKEAPGWRTTVESVEGEGRVREVVVRTPAGRTYRSQPPPLLGWGSDPAPARRTRGRPRMRC